MKNRFEVRGPAIGPCAICGTLGPLTEDHVPPKGAQRLAQVEMAQLWRRLNAQQKGERPPQFSQNGVKFRSICKVCNNVRLGAESDPEFLRFTKGVVEVIGHVQSTSLVLPRKLTVRAEPTTVLRSVVGHMLALNVGRAPRGPMEEAMAQYFLNPAKPLHRAMDVLYWLYSAARPCARSWVCPGARCIRVVCTVICGDCRPLPIDQLRNRPLDMLLRRAYASRPNARSQPARLRRQAASSPRIRVVSALRSMSAIT